MNKYLTVYAIIGVIVVLAGVLVLGRNGSATESTQQEQLVNTCKEVVGEVVILMKNEVYEPQDVQIKKCTKVIFKNADTKSHWPASNIHPTHGIYPEFDPKEPVDPGKEWSFVFDKVGQWRYHDHLFPVVRGVIEVAP